MKGKESLKSAKNTNTLMTLLAVLALICAVTLCGRSVFTRHNGASQEASEETADGQAAYLTTIRLGASEYAVDLPAGYVRQALTQDALGTGQVGTYTCKNNDMVVDVYNVSRTNKPSTLTAFAEREASMRDAELKFDVVNGTMVAYYSSKQEYDGTVCKTVTYLFDAASGYTSLVLRRPGGNLAELGNRIIRSLRTYKRFQLGETPYSILLPGNYVREEITFDEAFEGHIGYYKSASLPVALDLYQYSKEDQPNTLAGFAAQEAAKRDMEASAKNINGTVVMTFGSQQQYDGKVYNSRTYLLEASGSYIKLVFLLDGEGAAELAERMINTLASRKRLASSPYFVALSGDYVAGTVDQSNQVGAYVCDRTKLAFDIYEFSKRGRPSTLQDFAAEQAAKYQATAVPGVLNGNDMAYYRVSQDGKDSLTFILNNVGHNAYLKVVFRLPTLDQVDSALEIMQSLQERPMVRLGNSSYTLVVPGDLVVGTVKHANQGQVGSYFSTKGSLEFDVYEIAKAGQDDLQSLATKQAKKQGGTAVLGKMSKANVAYYVSQRDRDGQDSKALTFLIDAGDSYEEVIFWLSRTPALEVLETMRTLTHHNGSAARTSAMLVKAARTIPNTAGDVVRIGVFEPLTGGFATGGKWETLGIEYAHQETPTVEIDGKTYQVELVTVDNASDVKTAEATAKQLARENVSVVLGSFSNVASLAGSPHFGDASIPVIGMSCTGPAITDGKAHYFRICYTDYSAGALLASYAANELSAKTVYVLGEANNDHDRYVCYSFGQYLRYRGGTVVKGSFKAGTTDFRPYLKEAIEAGVDVMFCPVSTKSGVELVKQAAELNVPFPILGTNLWDNKDNVAKAAKGSDIQVITTSFYPEGVSEPFDEGFKAWLKADNARMKDNGGTATIFSSSAMGYDGYYTALEALKAAGTTNPLYVMHALPRVSFTGVTGAISFASEGNADRTSLFMKRANTEKGTWEYQMEYRVKK